MNFIDGRGSFDSEGEDLTYAWTIASAPRQSEVAEILMPGAAVAQFRPDVDGEFVVALTVSNSRGSDSVTILADLDGDGIPDVADARPFDAIAAAYPVKLESEFNDNPPMADIVVGATYPFRVQGELAIAVDGDYFRFDATGGDIITAVLYKKDPAFRPSLAFSDAIGNVQQAFEPAIDAAAPFDLAVTMVVPVSG